VTLETEFVLETTCGLCYGGGVDVEKLETRCALCDGVGYRPTELGRTVLEFLRHHLPAETVKGMKR